MKLSAVIFDLDGTVLDNEEQYGRAFKSVLKDLGVNTKEKRPQIAGIGVKENWPHLLKRYKIKTDFSIDDLAVSTQSAYRELIPGVKIREGFKKFISGLRSSGVATALATSNNWTTVESDFEELWIGDYFDVVTTAEEVRATKPDPDLFRETAAKLGVQADECLVVEDALSGIKAAKSAGMKAIGIGEKEERKLLGKAGADRVVSSFDEITPQLILSI